MTDLAAVGVLSSVVLLAVPAAAQTASPRVEQQARALQKKAIDDDYVSTEFAKAEDKLNRAVNLCGNDKCSTQTRAQLRRDLGVVQIGGQIDREKGIGNFVEALRLDRNIALDPDLKTKDLEQALDEAKARAGIGGAKAGPTPVPPSAPTPAPAPVTAPDPADCPPGFPCAKKPHGSKLGGETCEESSECTSDRCTDGKCAPAADAPKKFPRIWIGAGLGFDFLVLPAGDDVCKLNGQGQPNKYLPKNDAGYYCVTPEGTDYPTRADTTLRENGLLVDGKAGKVESGMAPANFRVWLSFDYALSMNFLVGARIGLVLRTFPGDEAKKDGHATLAPFHLEARLTYLVGKDAIMQPVAPYFFLASGAAEYSAHVEAPVLVTGEPGTKTVHAWEIAGPWFASLGAGIRVAFGDRKNMALLFGGRGNLTLPVAHSKVVPSFGPEANFQIGF